MNQYQKKFVEKHPDYYKKYHEARRAGTTYNLGKRTGATANLKEYSRNYYQKNKEKIKQKMRIWIENNRERFTQYRKNYYTRNPWMKHHRLARQRCNYEKDIAYDYYGGRGIKYLMKPQEIKKLWKRDRAHKLVKPSIERKNPDGNYEYSNCKFIEMSRNKHRGKRKAYLPIDK